MRRRIFNSNFANKIISMLLASAMVFTSCEAFTPLIAYAAGEEEHGSGEETSEPVNAVSEVTVGVDSYPDVDVILSKGKTNLDMKTFKSSLMQALNEYGLDENKIHIYAESDSDTQQDGVFNWKAYSMVHSNTSYPGDAYSAQGVLKAYKAVSNYRSGTMEILPRGTYSDVNFYGNWAAAGSFISFAPVPEPEPGYIVNNQTTTFDYNIDWGDSFIGAGYIINGRITDDGNYFEGYYLHIANRSYSQIGLTSTGLYKIKYPVKSYGGTNFRLHDGHYVLGRCVTGQYLGNIGSSGSGLGYFGGPYTLIQAISIPKSGRMKIVLNEDTINIYTKTRLSSGAFASNDYETKISGGYKLPWVGDKFGYAMFQYDHGCQNCGFFKLSNLQVETHSRIPFEQVLTNGSSQFVDNNLHFAVNVNDEADPGLRKTSLLSLMNSDKGYDGLHYIGWGVDGVNDGDMKSVLESTSVVVSQHEKALLTDEDYATGMYFTDNAGVLRRYRGEYISQNQHDYEVYDMVQETAEYIYNIVLKYMNKNDVVIENPARLSVTPTEHATNTAVSPGQYSYGKWTINHYGKTYEGNDDTNARLYGRRDLIEVDGDGVSGERVWSHEDIGSKYETPERFGLFEDVVIGTKSRDDQVYQDARGDLFDYNPDEDIYYIHGTKKVAQPFGDVAGTLKTGDHIESKLYNYEKIVDWTPFTDDVGSIRHRTSTPLTYVGSYIVMTDWGNNSANSSWVTYDAIGETGLRVEAYSLKGCNNYGNIMGKATSGSDLYITSDTEPVPGKIYYWYRPWIGFERFTDEKFAEGVTYYESTDDVRYILTKDTEFNPDKTYYTYGYLEKFEQDSRWWAWWNHKDFEAGVTYYEKSSNDEYYYFETRDTRANVAKTYYYIKNPGQVYCFDKDDFIHLENHTVNYYEHSIDELYFKTSDYQPVSGKTYYSKNKKNGNYVKFRGSSFKYGKTYYEKLESAKYTVTFDKYRQAGKQYYYLDDNGDFQLFTGLSFEENKQYYEYDTSDNDEDDSYRITNHAITLYCEKDLAVNDLGLTRKDSGGFYYCGPIVKGEITPVTEPFNVTPVAGDNTTVGSNTLFYVMRSQVDGDAASKYYVGEFDVPDKDTGEIINTGYVVFQIMDIYSADEYTSKPVYRDYLIDDYDPIVTRGIPILGDKEMNYRYDNDNSLYSSSAARVGDGLEELGLFEIFYEDQLIKTIYVHRLPHAKFRLKLGPTITSGENTGKSTVTYINESFDYDHYYSDGIDDDGTHIPGIVEELWEYREDGESMWHVGKLPGLIDRSKRYEVRLTVWDREGEFSQTSVMIGNGDDPPIAKFSLEGDSVTVDKGVKTVEQGQPITYNDMSYDPNGYDLTEYRWDVKFMPAGDKNSIDVDTGGEFLTTPNQGIGKYTYLLQVKNSKGVWSNIASDTITVIRARYNLYYNKNHESASQYGVKSKRVFGGDYALIDTNNNYARRVGWDFVGWGDTPDSHEVYNDTTNRLMMPLHDKTIYGIYNRYVTLRLMKDDIGGFDSIDFGRTIYTHDTTFEFDDIDKGTNGVNNGTKRDDVSYTVTYASNGASRVVSLGNTDTSTDISVENTAVATRTLNGWYTAYEGTEGAEKLGDPGTLISVAPREYSKTIYNVTGNANNTVTYNTDDKIIRIYPQWNHAYVKLPDCKRSEEKQDVNGTDEDKFIGWFTNPQPKNGEEADGGIYAGGPGDVVEIVGDITLYPWFNIAPVIVHSQLSDGFYEGQPLSYEQLMALVDAHDVDNPAPVGPEGLVTYDGAEAWIKLYNLNAETFLRTKLGLTDTEIASVMAQVNTSNFEPELIKATFYCDGKDKNGNNYSDCVERTQDQASIKAGGINGLDTKKYDVGKLDLLYQITDNGAYDGLTQILKDNGYSVDSPITVQYVLETEIKFNYNPTLDLTSANVYNVDEVLNNENIVRFILDKQKTNDKCDDTTNKPWWAAEEDEYAVNDKTKADLYGTLKIVDVYDIRFSTRYEDEHQAACEAAKNIHKLSDLWKLKETDPETFQHIISYRVEFDCMDQWGKTASGLIYSDSEIWDADHPELDGPYGTSPADDPDAPLKYGQSKEERSIIIVPFNNYDDMDLLLANSVVAESMRYIDNNWSATTLFDNQYWGNEGYDVLQNTFEKFVERNKVQPDAHTGSVEVNGSSVNIQVNDYSDK